MFASLVFGFFDRSELQQHNLVVRQPLDLNHVRRLFNEDGSIEGDGNGCVDGHYFIIDSTGFVESTSVLGSRKALDFVSRLVKETGCEIASVDFGGVLSLESIQSNFEHLEAIFSANKNQKSADSWVA